MTELNLSRYAKRVTHVTSSKYGVRKAYQLGWQRCLRTDIGNPYPTGRRHDAYKKGAMLGKTRKELESRPEAEEPTESPLQE